MATFSHNAIIRIQKAWNIVYKLLKVLLLYDTFQSLTNSMLFHLQRK